LVIGFLGMLFRHASRDPDRHLGLAQVQQAHRIRDRVILDLASW
jgi:cobyrinic acid a,c-diamide synthase